MDLPAPVCCPLLLAMFLAACNGGSSPPELEAEARRTTARALAADFSRTLVGELAHAVATDGPAAAVELCSERAPAIAAELARDGYSLRRIGTRVRNPANRPSSAERAVLERFAAMPVEQRSREELELEAEGRWSLYTPITIGAPVCLTCHGSPEQVPDDVKARLATRYPDDEAVGYALFDLRGAVVVETPR